MALCVPVRPAAAQPFASGVVVVSDDASTTSAIHAADIDGDGDLDLIGGGSDGVAWYENDGNASPEFVRHGITTEGTDDVFAVDLDGDGDVDVIADYVWYENDGGASPSFSQKAIAPSPRSIGASNISVADIDLDGDLDVLIADDYAGGDRYQRIAWYENSGGSSPAFGEHVIESESRTYTGGAHAADVDADGDNDIVSAGLWYENTNPSDPTFTAREQEAGGEGVGDIDNDGDVDVVQFGVFDVVWIENDGSSEPLAGGDANTHYIQNNDTPRYYRGHLADIDRDGDIDIATGGYLVNEEFAWYENDGSSTPPFNQSRISTPVGVGDDILAKDLNGDGTLDWITSGVDITWYENKADPGGPRFVQPSVSFGDGDPSDAGNYRLIALPGDVNLDLASLFSGEAGEEGNWRAFMEAGQDGSSASTLQECEVDRSCRFKPGGGYWALSGAPWEPAVTVDPISLSPSGAYNLEVHDGWNIISNPFSVPIDWQAVQAETGTDLGALYAYDGAWSTVQSMRSAANGEAYYFKNDAGISTLILPHPSAKRSKEQAAAQAKATLRDGKNAAGGSSAPQLQVEAMHEGQIRSRATIGIRRGGSQENPRFDVEAPPSLFTAVSIRAAASPSSRRYMLLEKYEPSLGAGVTFHVQLRAPSLQAVPLRVNGLHAFGAANVLLVERATGTVHTLKDSASQLLEKRVTIRPHPHGRAVRDLSVLIGSDAYVEKKITGLLPDQPVLEQSHPNPASGAVTIEYVLPHRQRVELALFDVLGRRIRTLATGMQAAGRRAVQFQVGQLPSGVYFYRLRTDGSVASRKMIIVR